MFYYLDQHEPSIQAHQSDEKQSTESSCSLSSTLSFSSLSEQLNREQSVILAQNKHLCKQEPLGPFGVCVCSVSHADAEQLVTHVPASSCMDLTNPQHLFFSPPSFRSGLPPAHVSRCHSRTAATLVYCLHHHPASAAHPALQWEDRKNKINQM